MPRISTESPALLLLESIKNSTESPALLTSREHDDITVTAIPEINATLVDNALILGHFSCWSV